MNFKFLNIPVYIAPAFWLFLVFFTEIYRDPSIEKLLVGVVLFVSLLIHEYGHALTAGYFGIPSEIYLEAFGGYAQYNPRGVTTTQQFWITLNGPLFESVLIVQSYLLLKYHVFDHYYVNYLLYITMRLNILWCLLNLIPVSPLDGGQLLRSVLEKYFKYKGYRASILIGLASAIVMVPYLYLHGYFFFSVLLVVYGLQNLRAWQETKV